MRIRAVMVALLLWGCGTSHSQPDDGGGSGGAGPSNQAGTSGRAAAGANAASGGGRGGAGEPGAGAGSSTAGHAGGSSGMTASDGGPAGSDADSGAPDVDAGAATPSCLDGIDGYAQTGPFAFDSARSGNVNVWVPELPAGCKVPVVHFANGTGATCANYAGILEHIASHGFLVACYESASADDGSRCLTALQTVFDEYDDIADLKIGSAGQEVGGGTAMVCLQRAEEEWGDGAIYAGHAIAPVSGSGAVTNWMSQYGLVEAPVFMFNGSEDVLVSASWVRQTYDALGGEKYWYEATGAPHIPVPVSWAAESAVVFFRWKLLGDEAAGDYFAAMPDGDQWDLQEQDRGP